MNKRIVLKNVFLDKTTKGDVAIENGIISEIATLIQKKESDFTISIPHTMLLPSFIDMQVHLRSPGQEEKEDLYTGTNAAAKGGYTHVACMPNTKPRLDNEQDLCIILDSVKNRTTKAHIYPIAAMTKGLEGKTLADYELFEKLGLIAITDDGFGVQDDEVMNQVFCEAKKHRLHLMQHCEFEHLSNGASFHEGIFTKNNSMKGYPSSAEYKMIERDLLLVEKHETPYHVLHVSTKEGVELVKQAKNKNLPVTCEVTPHHLLLCDEDIKEPWANYKMNPPIRSKQDREALVKALADGIIDIVSTDHAPHTSEEKNRSFELAPFGIIGLEFAWPLLYTHLYLKGKITLERLKDAFSFKARNIFNLPMNTLKVGDVANLTLIDMHTEKIATIDELCSKSKNTPFLGEKLKGWPVLTLWMGNITYFDQSHKGSCHGKYL